MPELKNWAVKTASGEELIISSDVTDYHPTQTNPGCTYQVIPRALTVLERFDWTQKKIVIDEERADEMIAPGYDKGPIHARKAYEAREFKKLGWFASLVPSFPFLQAESVAMGVTARQLAEQILAHDDATIAKEITRRKAKKALMG